MGAASSRDEQSPESHFRLRPVYLDYLSTTPLAAEALAAMYPYLTDHFANPSSRIYRQGLEADAAVIKARQQVASLVGAESNRVIFTSGSTESANWLIRGLVMAGDKGPWLVNPTEHRAILEPVKELESSGFPIEWMPVLPTGRVDETVFSDLSFKRYSLVVLMSANNETGVIQPVERLADCSLQTGVVLLSDAAQAVGKIPLQSLRELPGFLFFSAHKLYGPKGIGAVILPSQKSVRLPKSMITGGGQEQGFRSGTLNVPAIAGFGAAAELALAAMKSDSDRLGALRDRFEQSLLSVFPDCLINGSGSPRLPHVSSFSVPGIRPRKLLTSLKGIAVSAGSACSTGQLQPSHVLQAMKVPDTHIHNTIRLSLGRPTTDQEVDLAIDIFTTTIRNLRR